MLYCHLYCNSKCYFSSSEAYWQNQPQEVLYKKGVLINFSKFTRKHLCQSVFFKRLYYRIFPVNFPKFLRPLFLQNTFRRLLLYLEPCQISMIEPFLWKYRSSRPEVLFKKVLLEISQNPRENTCARVSFLIKLQTSGLQLYLKRDSNPGTSVFLWILRNF